MSIRYYKGEPSHYIIRYRNGRITEQGPGLAFWFLPFNTSIAAVPLVSQDAPFIFTETTSNFQEVSIQGQLSFRLTAPLELAAYLDLTIDPRSGKYRSKDWDKLVARVVNRVQAHTRSGVNALSLEVALTDVKQLAGEVLAQVQEAPDLVELGIRLESLHFQTVKATPEMQKALEADYRESLQKRADQAIYDRRKAAVEEESKISRRELDSDVELEERRGDLVTTQAQNRLTEAQARAKAREMEAEAETRSDEIRFRLYQTLSPQALLGLALKEWAANAGSIGNLNLSPDLLSDLAKWVGSARS